MSSFFYLFFGLLLFNQFLPAIANEEEVIEKKKKKPIPPSPKKSYKKWPFGVALSIVSAAGVLWLGRNSQKKNNPDDETDSRKSNPEVENLSITEEEKKLFGYLEKLAQYPDDPKKREEILKNREKEIDELIYKKKVDMTHYKKIYKGNFSPDYLFSLGRVRWLKDYLKTPLGKQCINISERKTGFTLLHTSTYRNQEEVVGLLLGLDFVDPNKQANQQNKKATPFHMAFKHGNIKTIECYLKEQHRLKIDLKTSEGDDIWRLAKKRKDPSIINLAKKFKKKR